MLFSGGIGTGCKCLGSIGTGHTFILILAVSSVEVFYFEFRSSLLEVVYFDISILLEYVSGFRHLFRETISQCWQYFCVFLVLS